MSQVATLLGLLCRRSRAAGTDMVPGYERAFAATVLKAPKLPALAFWHGRVALWAILRAAGLSEGDEVIVPAYTCEVVPIAVKFAGCKCVYVDVKPGEFNVSLQQIAEALTDRTKAILCQHTYGVAMQMGVFSSLVAGRPIMVVEDCCQLISGQSRHGRAGTMSNAAIFSTGWSKPYSTGVGGMAVFSDRQLYAAVKDLRTTFSHEDDRRRARSLAIQVLLYMLTVRPETREPIAKLYRWTQRAGMVHGTTSAKEYQQVIPNNYPAGGLNIQAILGMRELRGWDRNVQHRRMLTGFYLEHIKKLGVDTAPLRASADEPALWGIPLLLENQGEIIRRAERGGLPIIAWFGDPPVHVVPSSAAQYDYCPGQCPTSERMFPREVYLRTAPSVTLERARAAIHLLRRHAQFTSM